MLMIRNRLRHAAIYGAGLIVLSACGLARGTNGVVCTLEARPAITVQPVDAVTGASPAGSTQLVVRDGTYADSASAVLADRPDGATLSAAHERAGTYVVTIRNSGYATWTRSGVQVTRDECHVQTVRLRAELSRP